MPSEISRRSFLKGSAAAAGAAAVSTLALPASAKAAGGDTLCTVFDLSKCVGCGACVEACREQWQSTVPDPVSPMPQPFPAKVPISDWSKKKDVDDRLTPYNWLYLEHLWFQHKGEELELHVPRRCMHCDNPPCADLCPFGAGRIEKNGIVHIDPEVCLGGAKCKSVCPWHIPQRQSGVGIYLDLMPTLAGNGVMFKCTRCMPLVEKGGKPRCVEVCPEGVQTIGHRDQQLAFAEKLARDKAKADGANPDNWRDYVYGLTENGGTSTIYVTPVPFAEVTAAIAAEHGKQRSEAVKAGKKVRGNMGRPPMGPVGNVMDKADNMALAVVLAPVAGVAAGLTRWFGRGKKALDALGDRKEG